jgi:hypothetical protein
MSHRRFNSWWEKDMRKLFLVIVLALALVLHACQAGDSRGGSQQFRVAVAMFSHETCTFFSGGRFRGVLEKLEH